MTDFTNKDKFKFYHISRHAEIVVIKDRDVLAFIPECVSQDASVGIKIYRDQAQTFKVYESSPQVTINATERVLLCARVSGMLFIDGLLVVPSSETFRNLKWIERIDV